MTAGAGFISDATAAAMRSAIGFRNVLVHGYTAVDVRLVRDVLGSHLEDIEAFMREVQQRLSGNPT